MEMSDKIYPRGKSPPVPIAKEAGSCSEEMNPCLSGSIYIYTVLLVGNIFNIAKL
jgi:hypothetical protein